VRFLSPPSEYKLIVLSDLMLVSLVKYLLYSLRMSKISPPHHDLFAPRSLLLLLFFFRSFMTQTFFFSGP